MIRYALKCPNDHSFESWFKSAAAYDALLGAGQVACPYCGATDVEKALMAPPVSTSRAPSTSKDTPAIADQTSNASASEATPLAAPRDAAEAALKAMKAHVEANSEYVGMKFSQEARAMHDGDIPARPIYGEAKPDEAKSLIEDGVPVVPLPFTPKRQTN